MVRTEEAEDKLTIEDEVLNFLSIMWVTKCQFIINDLANYLGVSNGKASDYLGIYGLHIIDRIRHVKPTRYIVNPDVTIEDFTNPPKNSINNDLEDYGFGSGVTRSRLNPESGLYRGRRVSFGGGR